MLVTVHAANCDRKGFKIDKGSTIQWTGNPFDAQVDESYLSIDSFAERFTRRCKLIHQSRKRSGDRCIINLSENLRNQRLSLKIDLRATKSMKQRVRSIINTEEMMNRQIAYLLVLGKFYARQQRNTGLNNATISFAVSTFSAHLNKSYSKSLNTNNLSLGVDWQKSELQTSE